MKNIVVSLWTKLFYSIKGRILLLFLTISIPCIAFLLYSLQSYYQYAADNIVSEKEILVEEITQNLDSQFRYYKNATMTLYYNPLIRDYIESGSYSSQEEYIDAYLSGIVNSDGFIVSAVIELDGEVEQCGYSYYNMDDYFTKYRDSVIERKGRVVWIPTDTMSARYSSNIENFALARAVNSSDGTVGTMWVFFSTDFVKNMIGRDVTNQEGTVYYLMAPDGTVVYSSNTSMIGKMLDTKKDLELIDENELNQSESIQTDNCIVVNSLSNLCGWRHIICVDKNVAFSKLDFIRNMTVVIILLNLIIIVFAFSMLERVIFEPLRQLSVGMKKVSQKKFVRIDIKEELKKEDEINALICNYNFMTDEIQRLMLEIREEEKAKNDEKIKVLSMQINPHFVFNTLNTVRWMAIANKQTNIMKMVESLTTLLRNVAYTKVDEIRVEQELELIESYAYIQKMRFMNFDISYDLPDKNVKKLKIMRLTLQPFVENSITHGFEKLKAQGRIIIKIYVEDSLLHVWIEDNGCGFDTNENQKIIENIDLGDGHIGIENVQQRIRLYYGEKYSATVTSKNGEGTKVHLILPVITDMEDI